MKFWPVPHLMADSIYDVSTEMLKGCGISFLFIDVDNTIAPIRTTMFTPDGGMG